MDWIAILGAIKTAIDIVRGLPEAQEKGKQILDQFGGLLGKAGSAKEPDGVLATLVERQGQRLQALGEEFASKDADLRFDNIEKAAFRKRVAAQAKELLTICAPIKDQIPGYDSLLAFFDTAARPG